MSKMEIRVEPITSVIDQVKHYAVVMYVNDKPSGLASADCGTDQKLAEDRAEELRRELGLLDGFRVMSEDTEISNFYAQDMSKALFHASGIVGINGYDTVTVSNSSKPRP